ncbi:MAG TPA: hypothetical protein VNG53_07465 [Bacteroidia bacterium]|nr:hypothetical protein [Bacteroidia bacterium]
MKIIVTQKQAQMILKNIGNPNVNSITTKAGILDKILDSKQSEQKYNVVIFPSKKQDK